MEIYANKVALISYRENFLGVIVESKEINQMQRAAFELMWDSLESGRQSPVMKSFPKRGTPREITPTTLFVNIPIKPEL